MALKINRVNVGFNGKVYELVDGNMFLLDVLPYYGKENDKWHRVTNNDELPLIAFRYYKDIVKNAHDYWFIIAKANPTIFNPLDLENFRNSLILIPYVFNAIV